MRSVVQLIVLLTFEHACGAPSGRCWQLFHRINVQKYGLNSLHTFSPSNLWKENGKICMFDMCETKLLCAQCLHGGSTRCSSHWVFTVKTAEKWPPVLEWDRHLSLLGLKVCDVFVIIAVKRLNKKSVIITSSFHDESWQFASSWSLKVRAEICRQSMDLSTNLCKITVDLGW